jgi:hypothetical protein
VRDPESEAISQHLRHPYIASNNIRPFLLTPCLFCSHSYFTFIFFNFLLEDVIQALFDYFVNREKTMFSIEVSGEMLGVPHVE